MSPAVRPLRRADFLPPLREEEPPFFATAFLVVWLAEASPLLEADLEELLRLDELPFEAALDAPLEPPRLAVPLDAALLLPREAVLDDVPPREAALLAVPRPALLDADLEPPRDPPLLEALEPPRLDELPLDAPLDPPRPDVPFEAAFLPPRDAVLDAPPREEVLLAPPRPELLEAALEPLRLVPFFAAAFLGAAFFALPFFAAAFLGAAFLADFEDDLPPPALLAADFLVAAFFVDLAILMGFK